MKEPSRYPVALLISFFCIFCYIYCSRSIWIHDVWGLCQISIHFEYAHTLCFFERGSMDCGMYDHHVVAPVTKFTLTLTPIAYGIKELLPPAQQNSYVVSMMIRTVLMILILLVALTLPYFGVVMALTGSVLEMLVSIIFPCACYLRLLHGHTTTIEVKLKLKYLEKEFLYFMVIPLYVLYGFARGLTKITCLFTRVANVTDYVDLSTCY